MRFLVADLVERFDRDREVFLSPDYKEEQLRAEFLNPLLTALGWALGRHHLDTIQNRNWRSVPLFPGAALVQAGVLPTRCSSTAWRQAGQRNSLR